MAVPIESAIVLRVGIHCPQLKGGFQASIESTFSSLADRESHFVQIPLLSLTEGAQSPVYIGLGLGLFRVIAWSHLLLKNLQLPRHWLNFSTANFLPRGRRGLEEPLWQYDVQCNAMQLFDKEQKGISRQDCLSRLRHSIQKRDSSLT